MRPYVPRRTDATHAPIIRALRAFGVGVHDTSAAGEGFPDLLCAWRGSLYAVELKDGAKPPSERKLTDAQEEFQAMLNRHGCTLHVAKSVDEAMAIFGVCAQ